MNQNFKPIKLLQEKSDSTETGYLQITANSVIWKIYLLKGKLQYAQHSLQAKNTIRHYLQRHGCLEAGMKIAPMLENSALTAPEPPQLFAIINELITQGCLNSNQRTTLLDDLTQDALESCLWLTQGEYEWHSTNPLQFLKGKASIGEHLQTLSPLLESLQIRLQAWQKLSPLIISPYQRPLCVDLSQLQQKVPSGKLSPVILEKMVTLIKGGTIRQLGLFLKQEELRMAQLLFPYIQHKILQLLSPPFPLNKLPSIPQLSKSSPLDSANATPISPTETTSQVKSESKTYKVLCIDDSPTMLGMIEEYLGGEKYRIFTVEDPMKSLSYLFDSRPDIILMDFSMPGINGNRLCEILKKSIVFKNTPIIMVSGNTKMLDPETIRIMGATDFLAKPFTKESLLAMVEKYLI